ncbi:DUF6817 domain-containing protein [Phenylobacterium terrae]|uniref:DUF6817 domain-containing protein n=1 Tax=Phenylobacterium terrae TaxID=2665495 RepID=A0ABW4N633_9CAUL
MTHRFGSLVTARGDSKDVAGEEARPGLTSASVALRSLIERSQRPEHLYGSLEAHLTGTSALLVEWRASMPLCLAGMFHAAYGTDGWDDPLLGVAERGKLQILIGAAAERLVYLYCALDRAAFLPALGAIGLPAVRDRFSGKSIKLREEDVAALALLTAANELELLSQDPDHWRRYSTLLKPLFSSRYFQERLSKPAREAIAAVASKPLRGFDEAYSISSIPNTEEG